MQPNMRFQRKLFFEHTPSHAELANYGNGLVEGIFPLRCVDCVLSEFILRCAKAVRRGSGGGRSITNRQSAPTVGDGNKAAGT
jgi:hypothetical protein